MELEKHRDEIIATLKPVQKYLYSSPYSGQTLSVLAKKYNLVDDLYYNFALTVGDIILGFYKIEDTVPLLQQELGTDPKTAALLGAEVLEFLAPLSDPNWQLPVGSEEDGEESVDDVPEVIPAPVNQIPTKAPAVYTEPVPTVAISPVATAPVIPAPVVALPSYEPIPVSAPQPETVYQSTQAATLRPPLSTIPSYTPPATPAPVVTPPPAPDRPRWSTDI